jgi:hypothetical protein
MSKIKLVERERTVARKLTLCLNVWSLWAFPENPIQSYREIAGKESRARGIDLRCVDSRQRLGR